MTNNIADRKDVDGNPVSLHQLVLLEPDWACDKIRTLEAELKTGKRVWKQVANDAVERHNLRNENDSLKVQINELNNAIRMYESYR